MVKYQIRRAASFFTLLVILFLVLTGCSSRKGSAGGNNLKPLTLTRNLRISADNPKVLIGGFNDLAVDDRGNMYGIDRKQEKIHVFGPDGSYIDSLGRKGKGPGEFTNLSTFTIIGDTLYAMEVFPSRLSLFNLKTRSFIRAYDFPRIKSKKAAFIYPYHVFRIDHNRFEVEFREGWSSSSKKNPNNVTVVTMDSQLKGIKDTLVTLPPDQALIYRSSNSLMVFPSSFLTSTKISPGPNGQLFSAVTGSMRINGYDDKGNRIKTYQADYTPPALTTDQIDSIKNNLNKNVRKQFAQALDQITVPDHWPAIQNFLVDDRGRCWVELFNPGKPKQTWWVFNVDGKPEWKFKLPANIHLYVVKKGEVYGIENNEEGLPAIVRYKINKTEMTNG